MMAQGRVNVKHKIFYIQYTFVNFNSYLPIILYLFSSPITIISFHLTPLPIRSDDSILLFHFWYCYYNLYFGSLYISRWSSICNRLLSFIIKDSETFSWCKKGQDLDNLVVHIMPFLPSFQQSTISIGKDQWAQISKNHPRQ